MTREESIRHLQYLQKCADENIMTPLISRDKEALEMAIEALSAQPKPLMIAREVDEDTLERLKKAMANLPIMFVENEPRIETIQAQQWIPVTERLPERPADIVGRYRVVRNWYLVLLESGCVKSLMYSFDDKKWEDVGSPVVAWMPLPEPYMEV